MRIIHGVEIGKIIYSHSLKERHPACNIVTVAILKGSSLEELGQNLEKTDKLGQLNKKRK